MENRLTWQEIEQQFNQEWVELVDYEWPDGTPYPVGGKVRVHAADRKQFYQLMKEKQPQPEDSALVYVGIPPRDPNTVYVNPAKFVAWK